MRPDLEVEEGVRVLLIPGRYMRRLRMHHREGTWRRSTPPAPHRGTLPSLRAVEEGLDGMDPGERPGGGVLQQTIVAAKMVR